jgi:hypothetical protein
MGNKNLEIIKIPESELTKELDEKLKSNYETFEIIYYDEDDEIKIINQEGIDNDDEVEIINQEEVNEYFVETDEEEVDVDKDTKSEDDEDPNADPVSKTRINGVNIALSNLKSVFNPDTWEHMENSAGVVLIDTGDQVLVANLFDGNPEPKNMMEAK